MVDTSIEVLTSAIETPGLETVMKWIPTELVERTSARHGAEEQNTTNTF